MESSAAADFRIERLRLRNYRGFEDTAFTFAERFAVVIGDNGSGKSSLLDGLAAALSLITNGFGASNTRQPAASDVREIGYGYGPELSIEPQNPLEITLTGSFDGERFEVSRNFSRNPRPDRGGHGKVSDAPDAVLRAAAGIYQGESVTIPVVAHYTTGRLWAVPDDAPGMSSPGSRIAGYDGALDAGSNTAELLEWFKTRELIALQEGGDRVLDGVKAALRQCMPEWSDVYYSVRHDELIAAAGSDSASMRTFRTLSDGYRNVLAMVADIARRAATLNPHLGTQAPLLTPGVVLIDELDQHLHPEWQRRITTDLKRTFPAMQFVCTTHSPFIVQSLRAGELLRMGALGDEPIVAPAETFVERGIEDIAETAMHVDGVERSRRFHEQRADAAAYYEALASAGGSLDGNPELEAMLDGLVLKYADDPLLAAQLEIDRLASDS